MLETVGDALLYAALAATPVLFLPLVVLLSKGRVLFGAASALSRAADALTRTIGRGAAWLILAMALVQFGLVIARYVYGLGSTQLQEGVMYMHAAVALLVGAYALLTDDHVRVDVLYGSMPPRGKAAVDFAGTYLLLFPVCALAIWTAAPYVARSWLVLEGSNQGGGIPAVFLLKSLIPAFAVLLAAQGFSVAAKAAARLTGREI